MLIELENIFKVPTGVNVNVKRYVVTLHTNPGELP
jgi:hypothetical protein